MLARIAHELFWLGRNLGRAEHTARMLDGVFHADLQGRPDDPSGITLSWDSLLAIMGSSLPDGATASRDVTIAALTHDASNGNSVASCVTRARNGARALRDVISAEMWEAINTFHLELADQLVSSGPYAFVSYVKARCALFWGVAARTMLRDEAHAFLDAGGRFESADMVLRMLRVALPVGGATGTGEENASPTRDGQALALLQAVGGFQAYRRAVPAPPNAAPVASFLLFRLSYPDSVAASVNAARHALSVADINPRSSEPVLRLSRLLADLEFRGRIAGDGAELVEACEIVGRELALADRDIAERYFGGAAFNNALR